VPHSGILSPARWFAATLALLAVASPLAAVDYYLGSQAAAQPGTAVANLAALNQLDLQPGDRVFFQADETFAGSIEIRAEDAGTPAQPVVFSSFGGGRATIAPGTRAAIILRNAGGTSVSQLNLTGAGKSTNTASGIDAGVELPGSTQLEHLRFEQMRITGFRYGVEIWGWPSTATPAWPGFRDVTLSALEVFDNLSEGIRVWGFWRENDDGTHYAHTDFRVTDCIVYNQKGDPAATVHTGSGIVLSGVDGAVIERCVAHDNGGLGPATGGGPYGIWVFEANACTLQHNLVYNQKTSSNSDGGAFDLDGGSSNCVVQYNYSYQNDGPAIGLIQFEGASPLRNNVVRYNISENDGRAHAQGIVYVGQFSAVHGIDGGDIYGNTIFVSANAAGDRPPAVRVEDHARLTNIRLRNNLFIATHSGALIEGALNRPTIALYQGNNYWGGSFDLAAFRGGGQETLGSLQLGYRVDPKLQAPGNGGAVTNAGQLSALTAYRLQSGSPLATAGLDLTARFGINPGSRDFFGNPLTSAALPIGAATAAAPSTDRPIRLVNLSIRSVAGRGDDTLIAGFVVGGSGQQGVLVRGIGPGLQSLGVTDGALADPQLTLHSSAGPLASNDNWGGGAALSQQFAALGAFALAANSKDAALAVSLGAGPYSAHLTSPAATGIAMVEAYDATSGTARLINVSARTRVGVGDSILIAGFVLEGTGEKKLLIRGVGPSLVSQGIAPANALADPQLTLHGESGVLATNNNWAGAAALKTAFASAGAFGFESDASRDAALIATLGAGVYTVHLSGVNATTGIGLVEIYELP
jgi:hypothetical protein